MCRKTRVYFILQLLFDKKEREKWREKLDIEVSFCFVPISRSIAEIRWLSRDYKWDTMIY